MSEISSNQSLNKILDQLGINKTKEKFAPREVKDQLGQEDFLKLMTVQLQNQDPFAPVDNADLKPDPISTPFTAFIDINPSAI